MRSFVIAGLALLMWTQGASACVCFVPGSDRPLIDRVLERPVLFVGTALEVSIDAGLEQDSVVAPTLKETLFVVHAAWSGVSRDTLTVRSEVVGDCGADFSPGVTYVVASNLGGSVPELGICDSAYRLGHAEVSRMASQLPEPDWRAPAVGLRSIDTEMVGLGDPFPPGATTPVLFVLLRQSADEPSRVASIQIGDVVRTPERAYWIEFRLPPGFYRMLVRMDSGEAFEVDLLSACDRKTWVPPENCRATRTVESPPVLWEGMPSEDSSVRGAFLGGNGI